MDHNEDVFMFEMVLEGKGNLGLELDEVRNHGRSLSRSGHFFPLLFCFPTNLSFFVASHSSCLSTGCPNITSSSEASEKV